VSINRPDNHGLSAMEVELLHNQFIVDHGRINKVAT